MSLAHKIDQWYKEEGIRLNFDPDKSIYRTWFGREVPVIFDDKIKIPRYYPIHTKIILPLNDTPKEAAKSLIHEAGHANVLIGKYPWVDWTFLLSTVLPIYFLGYPEIDNGDLFDIAKESLIYASEIYITWQIVNEVLAESYRRFKLISPKVKKIVKF